MTAIEAGQVLQCNRPCVTPFTVCYRDHQQIIALHKIKDIPYGHLCVYGTGFRGHHILDPDLHIRKIERRVYPKGLEDKPGLDIDLPGPGSDYISKTQTLLEAGIGKGRTDRIRIRITVTNDINGL